MLLQEMAWPAVASLSKDTPLVIPIAAMEQHGHHLPLFTDSMLLGEIVRRTEQAMRDQVVIAPLMWLGNSHHHLDFPGTISSPPRAYLDMLVGLLDNAVQHGFRRILMLNGHGGNDIPGKQATFELRQQYRQRRDLLLLFSTYWSLADEQEMSQQKLVQSEMGHACEWETSMMLCIAPQLVGNYAAAETIEPGNPFRPATRAWTTTERSQPGHIGWPRAANADKGEFLLSNFARGVQHMLRRMIQWDGSSWEG
ncbi:MAG: creatininase family protein [Pirellulaceae bacterium]|nr:creatininase family protein [Pirellulaceae bacterium]